MEMNRSPVFAGKFYPNDPTELAQMVAGYLDQKKPPVPALSVVVPHAGYVYSGQVAGEILSHVALTRTVLVLCPKHTNLFIEPVVSIRFLCVV